MFSLPVPTSAFTMPPAVKVLTCMPPVEPALRFILLLALVPPIFKVLVLVLSLAMFTTCPLVPLAIFTTPPLVVLMFTAPAVPEGEVPPAIVTLPPFPVEVAAPPFKESAPPLLALEPAAAPPLMVTAPAVAPVALDEVEPPTTVTAPALPVPVPAALPPAMVIAPPLPFILPPPLPATMLMSPPATPVEDVPPFCPFSSIPLPAVLAAAVGSFASKKYEEEGDEPIPTFWLAPSMRIASVPLVRIERPLLSLVRSEEHTSELQ